jgi:hypothetical protein
VADAGWHTVMYRSSDSTLPTFSADTDNGPGGEVFFDVCPFSSLPAFSCSRAAHQVNLLSEDGTAALATSAFSRDGKYFAYGVSRSVCSSTATQRLNLTWEQGSDFCTVYVRSKDAPLAQSGDKRPSHDDARLSGTLVSCQTDDETDSTKTSSASSSSRASRGPRTRRASSTSASRSARRTARRTATRRGRRRTSTSTRRCTTTASASRRRKTC